MEQIGIRAISGIVAGLLCLPGTAFYVLDIFRGRTKPNRATWFIWAVVSWIILASYWASGARQTIFIPISYVIGASFVFTLSLKYGVGGWTAFDRFCLTGTGISLALWAAFGSVAALTAGIVTDFFGFLPTTRKAYHEPQTENRTSWTIGFFANILNLIAVEKWVFAIAIHPVFMFGAYLLMMVLLWRKPKK